MVNELQTESASLPHGVEGGGKLTTCGDCIMLAECSYEFGAHPDDPVCTGFREPLRTTGPDNA
jgi:hypothetical protein